MFKDGDGLVSFKQNNIGLPAKHFKKQLIALFKRYNKGTFIGKATHCGYLLVKKLVKQQSFVASGG